MKLYACFTVFDSLELLDLSFDNVVPFVDGVILCYQEVSNKGNRSDEVAEYLKRFINYPEVELVKYYTDLHLNPKENERRKHNLMLDTARNKGGTHFLMMAADHFYEGGQFYAAKLEIEKQDYDASFSLMYTYYKKPEWQLTPPEEYYMPFICKIYPHTQIERIRNYPVFVDPSVQVNTCKNFVQFSSAKLMLHHYSMVRKNEQSVRVKFENAASTWRPQQITEFIDEYNRYNLHENPGVKYFQGRKIQVVNDFFGLNRIFKG